MFALVSSLLAGGGKTGKNTKKGRRRRARRKRGREKTGSKKIKTADESYNELPCLKKDSFDAPHRLSDDITEWKRSIFAATQHNSIDEFKQTQFSVLLVTIPIGGSGDIMFLKKFVHIFKKWFPRSQISLLTNAVDKCKDLFEWENIYALEGDASFAVEEHEFVLKGAYLAGEQPRVRAHHVTFVLPHVNTGGDYSSWAYPMNMHLGPYVEGLTPLNTHWVGEYNESMVDIQPGIGQDALGIFLTLPPPTREQIPDMQAPFVLAYVTTEVGSEDDNATINNLFRAFCTAAFKDKNLLNVVVPDKILDMISVETLATSLGEGVVVEVIRKGQVPWLFALDDGGPGRWLRRRRILRFRGDVLPVRNLPNLMSRSNGYVLVTGDQSLSEALACCLETETEIWYQWTAWKDYDQDDLFARVVENYEEAKQNGGGKIKRLVRKEIDFEQRAQPVFATALKMALDPKNEMVGQLRAIHARHADPYTPVMAFNSAHARRLTL